MKIQPVAVLLCLGFSILPGAISSAEPWTPWTNKPQIWECESGAMQARVCASRMGEAQLKAIGKLCSKESSPTKDELKACILSTVCVALHKHCS